MSAVFSWLPPTAPFSSSTLETIMLYVCYAFEQLCPRLSLVIDIVAQIQACRRREKDAVSAMTTPAIGPVVANAPCFITTLLANGHKAHVVLSSDLLLLKYLCQERINGWSPRRLVGRKRGTIKKRFRFQKKDPR